MSSRRSCNTKVYLTEVALICSYRILVGTASPIPGLTINELNVIQNEGIGMTIVTQPEVIMFFVCIREPETSCWPTRSRFSLQDAEREAARIADLPVNTHILFGEIWSRRIRGYLCSMEKGVLKHWHYGRMVLVGESAHKVRRTRDTYLNSMSGLK